MPYSIELKWHVFPVNLELLEAHLRSSYPGCGGLSADRCLTVWFSEYPGEAECQELLDFWDALDAESEYVTTYLPAGEVAAVVETLKTGMLSKTWDQLSLAERKLILGHTPTREELGL